MIRSAVRYCLLPVIALLACAPSGKAHVFQTNMYPDIEFRDDALFIELWVATFLFEPLADLDFGDGKPRPPEDGGQRAEKIVSFFAENCPMAIDSKVIAPQLRWVKFEEMEQISHLGETRDLTMAKLLFEYPAPGMPRSIGVHWGVWFPDGSIEVEGQEEGEIVSHDPNVLDMLIFVAGEEHPMYLTKQEPEFIWHAPPREYGHAVPDITEEPPAQATTQLPMAPVIIGLGLCAFWLATGGGRAPMQARLGVAGLALVGAVAARSALPIEIPIPGKGLAKLDAAQAQTVFEKLHRNIYRAFEADGEDSIYNALAQSVDGVMLDRLYEEVYQSLLMRDEGGARSRVSSIDYLETNIGPQSDDGAIPVACTWRVNGTVRHWGHSHHRSNEYQADYTLGRRGDRWKVTSAVVNLQKRVPTPKP